MKPTKKLHQFILVLKNTHLSMSHIEDNLYKSGCDDALIHFNKDTIYLDFDREACSLEEAVISAINTIQSSSLGLEVISVSPENLVTESEIAKRLNLTRQTVSLWIKKERRQHFPNPVMRLREKSSLWNWSEVTAWLYKNNIINDKDLVNNAFFLANINAALEERDKCVRLYRQKLLKKISASTHHRNL